ncbi:hypothetical protein PYCC9005_001592 [Savitreella phatthalungensis]
MFGLLPRTALRGSLKATSVSYAISPFLSSRCRLQAPLQHSLANSIRPFTAAGALRNDVKSGDPTPKLTTSTAPDSQPKQPAGNEEGYDLLQSLIETAGAPRSSSARGGGRSGGFGSRSGGLESGGAGVSLSSTGSYERGPFAKYGGRTVQVVSSAAENGVGNDTSEADFAAAVRRLNSIVKANGVQRDFRAQKFYEKPHDTRVRLNSQRHRRRFLAGVKRLVRLVKEQRKYM